MLYHSALMQVYHSRPYYDYDNNECHERNHWTLHPFLMPEIMSTEPKSSKSSKWSTVSKCVKYSVVGCAVSIAVTQLLKVSDGLVLMTGIAGGLLYFGRETTRYFTSKQTQSVATLSLINVVLCSFCLGMFYGQSHTVRVARQQLEDEWPFM